MASSTMVFDFADERAFEAWASLNDTVMGGVSASRLEFSGQGTAVFTGTVSLDHGGGFASVRSEARAVDLGDFAGIALHVRGDGRRYKLNLRDAAGPVGVVHRAAFETVDGEWQTIRLRFGEFAPVSRGRPVPDAKPLDPTRLISFGLLISDKQAGAFRLEIARIEAFTEE